MELSEANRLVDLLGRQTKRELSNRGKLETTLFPSTAYENLASIEIFARYPDILRRIALRREPEELGRALPRYGSDVLPMQFWTLAFQVLWGRQVLIHLGALGPGERLREVAEVLEFWKRINATYRSDGKLCNGEAGHSNRVLSASQVRALADDAVPLDEPTRKRLARLHGRALSFLILLNCESRATYGATGPYPLGEGRVLLVADFAALDGARYPWGPLDVPCAHLTFALVLDGVSVRLANAGLPYTRPPNYLESVAAARVHARRPGGALEPLEPAAWEALDAGLRAAHLQLYRAFAGMSLRERVLAGATVYFWFVRPLAEAAGVGGEVDWSLKHCLPYYDAMKDAESSERIFEEALLLPREEPSSYTPLAAGGNR